MSTPTLIRCPYTSDLTGRCMARDGQRSTNVAGHCITCDKNGADMLASVVRKYAALKSATMRMAGIDEALKGLFTGGATCRASDRKTSDGK